MSRFDHRVGGAGIRGLLLGAALAHLSPSGWALDSDPKVPLLRHSSGAVSGGATSDDVCYPNLGSGTRKLAVIAANESCNQSDMGATFDVLALPSLWRTVWFKAAVAVLAISLLWLVHRWRRGRKAKRVRERVEARLSERALIAQDLHDTLLQSTQILTWRFHAFAVQLPKDDQMRDSMEAVLQTADRLLKEARESLQGLRSGKREELSQALTLISRQFVASGPPVVASTLIGEPRSLPDDVWLESYRIAREALWNACRYADASAVSIRVEYGEKALTVEVRDDGRGFVAAPSTVGEPLSHWGLSGMKERATRVGATCEIEAVPSGGTAVTLRILASRAYERPSVRQWRRRRRGWYSDLPTSRSAKGSATNA